MHRYKDAHDLMPDSIAQTIPRLNATNGDPDRTVRLKWYTPDSSWSWYVIEFDPEEKLCFGLVDGLGQELTYFTLHQIEHLRGPYGRPVERDLRFAPTPLSQLYRELARRCQTTGVQYRHYKTTDDCEMNAPCLPQTAPTHLQEKIMTDPVRREEFREAIQRVVEYMHDEEAHYEATIQDGQSGTDHIYHALCTLRSWLDAEQGHALDGPRNQNPGIEPGSVGQPQEHPGADRDGVEQRGASLADDPELDLQR